MDVYLLAGCCSLMTKFMLAVASLGVHAHGKGEYFNIIADGLHLKRAVG